MVVISIQNAGGARVYFRAVRVIGCRVRLTPRAAEIASSAAAAGASGGRPFGCQKRSNERRFRDNTTAPFVGQTNGLRARSFAALVGGGRIPFPGPDDERGQVRGNERGIAKDCVFYGRIGAFDV